MAKNYIGGQKEKTTDSINVNYGRDFKYKILADIVEAKDGNICPQCQTGRLKITKGFEWGHTFKIGLLYSRGQDGFYIDKNGRRQLLWMGSYGIGLGRCMALIVESCHDKNGIIWPKSTAPFDVHLIGIEDIKLKGESFAEKVYQELLKAKIDVLYDDRDVSAGVKFSDADLIGIPVRLNVSKKTKNKIEWKDRGQEKKELLSLKEVIAKIKLKAD